MGTLMLNSQIVKHCGVAAPLAADLLRVLPVDFPGTGFTGVHPRHPRWDQFCICRSVSMSPPSVDPGW